VPPHGNTTCDPVCRKAAFRGFPPPEVVHAGVQAAHGGDVNKTHTCNVSCVVCRYEVQGEYVIPPDTHIPDSAASMAPMELMGARSGPPLKPPKSAFEQATGRWRLQVRSTIPYNVNVPHGHHDSCMPFACITIFDVHQSGHHTGASSYSLVFRLFPLLRHY